MYEPVEDGVSDGGIADPFVPGVDGVLAGDEGGAAPLAVVEDLEEEAVLVGLEGRQSPIVDEEQVDAGQFFQQPGEAAVGLGQVELTEELGHVAVEGSEALSTGLVGQGAGQIGLAHPGGTGDEAVAVMADPVAGGQLLDGGALEATGMTEVDVLQTGALLEPGELQASGQGGWSSPRLVDIPILGKRRMFTCRSPMPRTRRSFASRWSSW